LITACAIIENVPGFDLLPRPQTNEFVFGAPHHHLHQPDEVALSPDRASGCANNAGAKPASRISSAKIHAFASGTG
jgi:hypothetical protein